MMLFWLGVVSSFVAQLILIFVWYLVVTVLEKLQRGWKVL